MIDQLGHLVFKAEDKCMAAFQQMAQKIVSHRQLQGCDVCPAQVYHNTVGHNCNLLLDYAPTPEGLIDTQQVERYKGVSFSTNKKSDSSWPNQVREKIAPPKSESLCQPCMIKKSDGIWFLIRCIVLFIKRAKQRKGTHVVVLYLKFQDFSVFRQTQNNFNPFTFGWSAK